MVWDVTISCESEVGRNHKQVLVKVVNLFG